MPLATLSRLPHSPQLLGNSLRQTIYRIHDTTNTQLTYTPLFSKYELPPDGVVTIALAHIEQSSHSRERYGSLLKIAYPLENRFFKAEGETCAMCTAALWAPFHFQLGTRLNWGAVSIIPA